MTPEQSAALREKFPEESIGKLPRVWCRSCTEANKQHRGTTCEKHTKIKCGACHNNITEAHVDLDFVGHAGVTDRLLEVDPEWSWEPFALDADGLPAVKRGELWIRLTVAGVTRPGVGDGSESAKELISDALRNAAMRFGVALDLWSRQELSSSSGAAQTSSEASGEQVETGAVSPPAQGAAPVSPNRRDELTSYALSLDAQDQIGSRRADRHLPPINRSNAEELDQWQLLLDELKADLEKPFEEARA